MQTDNTPRFLVIEGIDGAGTTTQARQIVRRFIESGRRAICTAEPTDGPIGALIRDILGSKVELPNHTEGDENGNLDAMTLLFSADRLDHLQRTVLPALAEGVTVVSDRYFYSTIAYQGVRGDLDWIRTVNDRALRPDLVFYLKVDPETALRRIEGRPEKEIYEKLEFQRKVVANYERIFADDPSVIVLNGELDMDRLSEEIWSRAKQELRERE